MEKFRKMIQEIAARQVPVQTRWVDVVSVSGNTLTAKDPDTGLEYFDVLMGLDAELRKPKQGTRALIGIIENKPAASFLILAKELDEFSLLAELTKLNGDQHGGLLIAQKLFDELDKEKARIDGIMDALKNSAVAANDGGAVYKLNIGVALNAITNKGTFDNKLVNDKVKHG